VVTEDAAKKFFDENRSRINGDFGKVKYQIIDYLLEQEKETRTKALAEQLRRETNIQIFLTPPEPPVYEIATDDQPVKGSANAQVTLVEFTDYQCPSCARQHPVLERLIAEYGDRVRLVVRDFPLSQHREAAKAAEAAEAAREQNKYWEYVALLFKRQSALQPAKLKVYATELGLDRAKFDASLDSGKNVAKVHRDLLDGEKLGVGGTPTLFLNGRPVSDRSYEGLKTAVEEALRKAR
jgi:protein-disulfide isomerase